MKRFINCIVKHHEGILLCTLLGLFLVAEAEPEVQAKYILIALIPIGISAIGRRISNKRKDEESL